jgi:hypothetical protein
LERERIERIERIARQERKERIEKERFQDERYEDERFQEERFEDERFHEERFQDERFHDERYELEEDMRSMTLQSRQSVDVRRLDIDELARSPRVARQYTTRDRAHWIEEHQEMMRLDEGDEEVESERRVASVRRPSDVVAARRRDERPTAALRDERVASVRRPLDVVAARRRDERPTAALRDKQVASVQRPSDVVDARHRDERPTAALRDERVASVRRPSDVVDARRQDERPTAALGDERVESVPRPSDDRDEPVSVRALEVLHPDAVPETGLDEPLYDYCLLDDPQDSVRSIKALIRGFEPFQATYAHVDAERLRELKTGLVDSLAKKRASMSADSFERYVDAAFRSATQAVKQADGDVRQTAHCLAIEREHLASVQDAMRREAAKRRPLPVQCDQLVKQYRRRIGCYWKSYWRACKALSKLEETKIALSVLSDSCSFRSSALAL